MLNLFEREVCGVVWCGYGMLKRVMGEMCDGCAA